MKFPWLFILLTAFFEGVNMFSVHRIRQRWAKECGYDCSQCGAWDCEAKTCNKKRAEDEV